MSRDLFQHIPEGGKLAGDILSFTALLGTLVSALPDIASLLTVIWLLLRIYEMETVQRWFHKRRDKQ